MDRLRRLLPFVKPLLILALFALALRALQDTLSHYRYHDVVAYVSSLRADQIILAAVLTLLGYLVMTGYDTLAFRYIRHPLPYRKIALASFIGYAFNNNVGLSGLVGGSLRYRLYTAWRLSAVEIAKAVLFLVDSNFVTGECIRVDGGRHTADRRGSLALVRPHRGGNAAARRNRQTRRDRLFRSQAGVPRSSGDRRFRSLRLSEG